MTQSVPSEVLRLRGVGKTFVLHNQEGRTIPVIQDVDLSVQRGDCVALTGPSGSGKSTLIRMIYGNYGCEAGSIEVRADDGGWINLAMADPRTVVALRRRTIGYVSQFLRVIPRVSAVDVVAQPLREAGADDTESRTRARHLLQRLNLPEALWDLSPTTFSGGEQQRVNIARGFAYTYPVLLLDEPTASLDRKNREVVLQMITEARDAGTAILGIFHDADARETVCNRSFDVEHCRVNSDRAA